MTAKGHIALALAPAIAYSHFFIHTYELKYIWLGSVVFGSLLPDIDEPNSYIGRRYSFLSIPLKLLGIKHRTFTHYLLFPLLILVIAFFVYNMYIKTILLGLAFGILMHDVGDMLTKGGIKGFLYPCCKEKVFRLLPKKYAFYTNSIQEWIIIVVLYLCDSYLLSIFRL